MKALILCLGFVFVAGCVTSGVKARFTASEKCNIANYKDFINKKGVHNCDLQGANLRWADLRGADLRRADLQWTNFRYADLEEAKVTAEQAEYLKSEGFSGFVVVE